MDPTADGFATTIDFAAFARQRISREFDLFRRFLSEIEPTVDKIVLEWFEGALHESFTLPGEFAGIAYLTDDDIQRDQFSAMLLHSFFSAMFASFEHRLLWFCERAERYSKSSSSVSDVKESCHIVRAKKYLLKLGVDFQAQGCDWQEIHNYRHLRNAIMHGGSSLTSREGLRKYAEGQKITTYDWWDQNTRLTLNREFCEKALTTMERFLLELTEIYEQWREKSR